MSKLKLGISTLFILLSIVVVANIIISSSAIFFGKDLFYLNYSSLDAIPIGTKLLLALKIIAMLIFVSAVFIFIKAIIRFSKDQFFDEKLIRSFSKAGFLFFVAGLIGFITSLLVLFINIRYTNYFNLDSRSLYVMLMIIGLFLFIFKNVLENGKLLKQENDLTI